MTEIEIKEIIEKQRQFFYQNKTLDIKFRIENLIKLKYEIIKNEDNIVDALHKDLGKSRFESYMSEIGMVLSEITYMIKHIKKFSKDKKVKTPLAQFRSKSYVKSSPYGVVLIISPWNYPFLLSIQPLIDAISAGNTVILKPSAYSIETTKIIEKIINNVFKEEYVKVITGGRKENTYLLDEKFDYIFFTGSKSVGKEVMMKASKYITPVTLELGGKSPCIVDSSASISLAARRIVFGKFLNCGQTCVAPDYILCDNKIKKELIDSLIKEIKIQYSSTPLLNKDYGHIVNEKHFDRLISLIAEKKVIYGGKYNFNLLKIEPTIIDNVDFDDLIMQEEIFGPLLPIITYKNIDDVIKTVNNHPNPLALYIFSKDKNNIKRITEQCKFGGGCINDTIIHLATSNMGFGGVGESGMGSYHGKIGFDTFSHKKSIVDKKNWLDLNMRYQPYTKVKERIIRFFLK